MTSYHNTTESIEPELGQYEKKAQNQEEKILAYFESHLPRYVQLTPTDVLGYVFNNTVPITSVRRALSNLTRDGHLVQSGQTMGPYGRPEHYWRLARPQQEMF